MCLKFIYLKVYFFLDDVAASKIGDSLYLPV